MFGQQITGQAFASQYSVIFYQKEGFESLAFFLNIMNNVAGLLATFLALFTVDGFGRRSANPLTPLKK